MPEATLSKIDEPIMFEGMMLHPKQVERIKLIRRSAADLRERLEDPTDFNTIEDIVRFEHVVVAKVAYLRSAAKPLP